LFGQLDLYPYGGDLIMRENGGQLDRVRRLIAAVAASAFPIFIVTATPGCGSPPVNPAGCFNAQEGVTSCAQLSEACSMDDGCTSTPVCVHNPLCGSAPESVCDLFSDCQWTGQKCLVTVDPCPGLDENTCQNHIDNGGTEINDCEYTSVCQGVLKSCEAPTQADCERIPHCGWFPAQ
jgi:hypothetical protein